MPTARRSLILSMLIFGTIGIFRKYIPLSSGMLAMLRGFIGVAFLCAFLAVKKERLSFDIIRKKGLPLAISGALIGLNWIFLFEAYNYTSVAVATLCYYMAPILVILLSPLVLKEALPPRKLICVAVAFAGMVLVSGVVTEGMPSIQEATGIGLGLAAAALYACVILMNKRLADVPAYDKTIVQLLAAGVVLLPYNIAAPVAATAPITPLVIALVAVVGVVHTGVAYALYFGAIGKLPAQTVALFSYIDPVTAIVLSLVIFQEPMTLASAIGAVMVLGATLWNELK